MVYNIVCKRAVLRCPFQRIKPGFKFDNMTGIATSLMIPDQIKNHGPKECRWIADRFLPVFCPGNPYKGILDNVLCLIRISQLPHSQTQQGRTFLFKGADKICRYVMGRKKVHENRQEREFVPADIHQQHPIANSY
nr:MULTISPECIES: hypothetical protein [Thalassospira]